MKKYLRISYSSNRNISFQNQYNPDYIELDAYDLESVSKLQESGLDWQIGEYIWDGYLETYLSDLVDVDYEIVEFEDGDEPDEY